MSLNFMKGATMKLNRFKVLEYMAKSGMDRQKALAERVGVTPQALSGWMNGEAFTLDNLGALCRALNCTPNDILDYPNLFSLAPATPAPMAMEAA
jgi:DNA-binding Xre family transcriptional regulator